MAARTPKAEPVEEQPEAAPEPVAHDTLAAALVAALAQLGSIPKAREAKLKKYSYSYADLGDVLEHVRPILGAHGLGVLQNVTIDSGFVRITTTLLHASGESMQFGPLPLHAGNTPQQAGSAITYARRYALLAALGIATEDDDGQAAAQRPPQRQQRPAPPEPRSDEEATIRELIGQLSREEREDFRERFTFTFGSTLLELPPEQHPEALAWTREYLDPTDSSPEDEEPSTLDIDPEPDDGSGY